MLYRLLICALCLAPSIGCEDSAPKPNENKGIMGKKTQDIGQFDPKAKQEVSDSKVRATNPITGPLEAYGPMVEQISKLGVEQAVNMFYATEGRYPKDYDEFMKRIIKENNIQLPVLPAGRKYQYDVATHSLVVVIPASGVASEKK